jgi:carbonic anhydrase
VNCSSGTKAFPAGIGEASLKGQSGRRVPSAVARTLRSANIPSVLEELLQSNHRYATDFSLAGIPARAAKGISLVTCMDSRIEPLAMLGLHPGDAKILRNAGGRVTEDVLRSLVLATTFLGVTEIAVMQHTDCALAHRSDDDIRVRFPAVMTEASVGWEFLAMPDPDASLRSDVEAVRSCELLPNSVRVEGWRYDVETGVIVQVVPS